MSGIVSPPSTIPVEHNALGAVPLQIKAHVLVPPTSFPSSINPPLTPLAVGNAQFNQAPAILSTNEDPRFKEIEDELNRQRTFNTNIKATVDKMDTCVERMEVEII